MWKFSKKLEGPPECCCSTVDQKTMQTLWLIHQTQKPAWNECKSRILLHHHSAKLRTKHIKIFLLSFEHTAIKGTNTRKQTLKKVPQRKSRGRSQRTRKRKATFGGPSNWLSMKARDPRREVGKEDWRLAWEWKNTLRKAKTHSRTLRMTMSLDLHLESWRMGDEALLFVMAVFVLFPHANSMEVSCCVLWRVYHECVKGESEREGTGGNVFQCWRWLWKVKSYLGQLKV